jgi:hypothetical protein
VLAGAEAGAVDFPVDVIEAVFDAVDAGVAPAESFGRLFNQMGSTTRS